MPARSVTEGNQERHTWVTEDRVERGSGGTGVFGGVSIGSGGHRGVGVGVGVGGGLFGAGSERCERTLVFQDGRVVDGEWQGDAQFCRRFARR